ncbi:unnamed protein product [Bursaphelenchus xylophilus]|uniref:(pine wood nematode) hypothetical protein n=1 Tax=Bursaphelenchus xylophilus TaxID=6326 RepID=A0A1I7S381_BURXY|nr:unnamed protein product [Bursaphelenchus xylophilus]CAG9116126.1 unnamed protein product [Bursaphelenchus xylophilus]
MAMQMMIPLYELPLMSSDSLIAETKVVSLGPGEDARIRCTLQDSGFDPQSLFLTMNNHNMTGTQRGHHIIYDITDYDPSKGELVFDCAARRRNQKFQVRSLKVVPKVYHSCKFRPCSTRGCGERGLCLEEIRTGAEHCFCPGKGCQVQEGSVISPWIWISGLIGLSLGCFLLGILLFLAKKATHKRDDEELKESENLELKEHSDKDVDLEVLYDQADNLLQKPPDPNDYDNLRYDRGTSTQT